jgi:hypothetical protein
MPKRALMMALPLFPLAVVVACSSNKPAATPAPVADGGMEAAAPAADGGLAIATPAVDAGAPEAGVASLADTAFDAAIDLAVTTASAKAAPKMEREGQPGRATLKEGEHFGMVVTLQPNRCYTIIGSSPPGAVTQLDLKLLALPLMMEAGKSAPADKSMPIIGKGTAALCPILPVAVPYKIDAAATKGAGRIGIHVYSRAK